MVAPSRSGPPVCIGIAGGSGSGKTTLANQLVAALPDDAVVVLKHDSYYRDHPELDDEARAALNFDHPESLETSLLIEHLAALKAGRRIEQPRYNFSRHRREAQRERVEARPVIVVEGILTFVDPGLRDLLDIKIYVDTDPDIRLMRRIRRDMEARGRTFDSVRQQWYETVRPMHLEFVEPSRRHADLIVPEGGDNQVALGLLLARLREVI